MLHPLMTAELVRQRRAELDAEAALVRLAARSPVRTTSRDRRLAATTRTLARRVRALATRVA